MEPSPPRRTVADIDVDVTARLAEVVLSLEEVLAIRVGSTIDCGRDLGEPREIEIDGGVVGDGHVVERQGRLGFRIEHVAARSERG